MATSMNHAARRFLANPIRTIRSFTLPLSLALLAGIALGPPAAFTQSEKTAKPPAPAKPAAWSKHDLATIQRKVEQLRANHETLRSALQEIQAELQIVKVRVTQ